MFSPFRFLAVLLAFPLLPMMALAENPFGVHVIDEETGRGIPMIEVKIVPDQVYMTDSNGWAAIDDPTLMNQEVFLLVMGQGYSHKQDQFGYPGRAVKITPGGETTFKMKRTNIAERIYRVTGIGIYRDSVMLNKPVPIKKPLINSYVTGLDSVQTALVGDTVYYFWGDTDQMKYPLGSFGTTGAYSKLPEAGGLDPSLGIDLEYFEDPETNFIQPMFEQIAGLATWVDGVFSIENPQGETVVLAHAEKREGLGSVAENKLCVLDPDKPGFETVVVYDDEDKLWPNGQAFKATVEGQDYIYFACPYPVVRVPARWDAVIDSTQYEAYTPLVEGSTKYGPRPEDQKPNEKGALPELPLLEPKDLNLEWDNEGRLKFGWKRNTSPLLRDDLQKLIDHKIIDFEQSPLRTIDAQSGKEVQISAASVNWNEYRQRYIMTGMQVFGDPSMLGEIWYAESKNPEGPYYKAVKTVSHYKYSFYNPCHHEYFDQDDGRTIYFEATYTTLFTEGVTPTPWYDYNNIMYKLDLSDPRLKPAHVE